MSGPPYTANHLLAIRRHAPEISIHDVLLNAAPILEELIEPYAAGGAVPIPMEVEPLEALGCRPVVRDLLGVGPRIRHDPHKLALPLLELATEVRE